MEAWGLRKLWAPAQRHTKFRGLRTAPWFRVVAVLTASAFANILWLGAAGASAEGGAGNATSVQDTATFDEGAALRLSQAAIGRTLRDYSFRDTALRTVRLSDFRGRPLVINLVYTGCSHACPMTIETLGRAVDVAREALGPESFSVVTVGFDSAHDTPQRMRAFAREHGVDAPNWTFLSADSATVDSLARDLGFVFFPSAAGFEHSTQTTVVDEEGRIYRQVYGADFESPALVEPLKDIVFGRRSDLGTVSGIINRIRLLCTLYNPESHRYRFDYSIFIGMFIGFVSLTTVAVLLVRGWLHSRPLR